MNYLLKAGVAVIVCLPPVTLSAREPDPDTLRKQALQFFQPLPKKMPGSERDTPAQVNLGRKLFFETALSINNSQSCNSCHRVDNGLGGVDNEKTSPGALGKRGDRNSPTVWNAGLQFAQFWDGRAPNLVEQAKGPILNPIEMGLPDPKTAIRKLKQKGYGALFQQAFPDEKDSLTYDNLARAIAAFERTLITRDRFDLFLKGDSQVLSENELRGLDAFMSTGCTACHTGALIGGQMFQKAGLVNAFPNTEDTGRYRETGNDTDKFLFKVPSLRNIGNTAPYFHDGSIDNLQKAVADMAWHQLGKKLDHFELENITAFLRSLDNTKTRE